MRPIHLFFAALIATTGSVVGCFLGFGDYKVGPGAASSSGAGGGGGAASATSSASGMGGNQGGASSAGSGSTGGGGGGGGGCGPGSTVEFKDDFDDNMIGPQWNPYTSAAAHTQAQEVNQGVSVFNDGTLNAFAVYYWKDSPRSLLGCEAFIEVKQVASLNIPLTTYFQLMEGQSLTNVVGISQNLGKLSVYTYVGGTKSTIAQLSFDKIMHRWWRIRESKGKVYFETAPDGKTWSQQTSIPTPAFASAVHADFGVRAEVSALPGGVAIFDNMNVPPP